MSLNLNCRCISRKSRSFACSLYSRAYRRTGGGFLLRGCACTCRCVRVPAHRKVTPWMQSRCSLKSSVVHAFFAAVPAITSARSVSSGLVARTRRSSSSSEIDAVVFGRSLFYAKPRLVDGQLLGIVRFLATFLPESDGSLSVVQLQPCRLPGKLNVPSS